MNEKTPTLSEYRAAIRDAWLPIVGRDRLSSAEYELIAKWFAAPVSLNVVLKAIKSAADRAKRNSTPIYSLGVIRADLQQLQRKHSTLKAGNTEQGPWRERWKDDLLIIIEGTNNPDEAQMCRDLILELPKITYDQAKARWREIQMLYR